MAGLFGVLGDKAVSFWDIWDIWDIWDFWDICDFWDIWDFCKFKCSSHIPKKSHLSTIYSRAYAHMRVCASL